MVKELFKQYAEKISSTNEEVSIDEEEIEVSEEELDSLPISDTKH